MHSTAQSVHRNAQNRIETKTYGFALECSKWRKLVKAVGRRWWVGSAHWGNYFVLNFIEFGSCVREELCIIAFRALRRLIGNPNLIVLHFRVEQLIMADGHRRRWWSMLCVRNIQMRSNAKLSFRFGRNQFGISNSHFEWLIEFWWNCMIDKSRNTSISRFIFHFRFNLIEILLRVILLQIFYAYFCFIYFVVVHKLGVW